MTVKFIKRNPIEAVQWNNVPALRNYNDAMGEQYFDAFKRKDVQDSTQKILMSDGYKSEIGIFKPVKPPKGRGGPLIVLIYGGGFVMGSWKQTAPNARALASLFGAVVLSPNYRLAPEYKFPTAPNDIWDTLQWIVANTCNLGADPSKGFILGGISAGGNLAAITAQRYVNADMSPRLTGLWLSIPAIFHHSLPPPSEYSELFLSRQQNANSVILNQCAIDAIDNYLQLDPTSPLYSPFYAKDPHVGMPPCYIQVDGLDPLRDDGLIYEKVLRKHGVKTRMDVYPGLPHGHWGYLPMLKSSVKANVDILNGFAWLLGRTVPTGRIIDVLAPCEEF